MKKLYAGLSLSALILFCGIYGFSMLDISNISYIYNNYDTEQHYFGWMAYRDAPFMFPPGLGNRLIYPDASSVIFTDSIPLIAFLFKLISPLLPETFQYFGLWTLFSMLLSGVLTANILLRHGCAPVRAFFSGVLMMLVPTVMIRAFAHEALAGQWLVILSLSLWDEIYVRDKTSEMPARSIILQGGFIGFLASGIHLYFLPICGIILLGTALYLCLKDKRIWQAVSLIASYIASAALGVWLWGGFSVDLPPGDINYEMGNAANLNTLFNPLDDSFFLHGLPLYYVGQDDGYGYLGFGMWIIMAVGIFILLREKLCDKALLISVILMFIVAFFFSTYPILSFGEKVFFSYRLPHPIHSVMAIFRCNGRGIWVITYSLMIGALILINKKNGRWLPVFLILCIGLQIADLSPLIREKYTYCNEPRVVKNSLSDSKEMKEALATGRYEHVFMDESLLWAEEATNFAMENHLTTNRFYLARQNEEANARRNREGKQNLRSDTLYIFPVENEAELHSLGLKIIYRGEYNLVGVTDAGGENE